MYLEEANIHNKYQPTDGMLPTPPDVASSPPIATIHSPIPLLQSQSFCSAAEDGTSFPVHLFTLAPSLLLSYFIMLQKFFYTDISHFSVIFTFFIKHREAVKWHREEGDVNVSVLIILN